MPVTLFLCGRLRVVGKQLLIALSALKTGFRGIILNIRKFDAVYHDTTFRCKKASADQMRTQKDL